MFDVVGSGDAYNELRDELLARHRGRVRFLGRLSHDEMREVWTSHDVFIQTSDFEGTSVSMLEAMAHGVVPVVTAASSGIAGVVDEGRNGHIVPVGDMATMARRIAALAGDRERLIALGQNSYQTAQRYSLDLYGEQFAEVLDRVVEGYCQAGPWDRYGMFAGSHPIRTQQERIRRLEDRIAWLEQGPLARLATRLARSVSRRRRPRTSSHAVAAETRTRRAA